jgi:Ca2+-binding RTX toxin-like protein
MLGSGNDVVISTGFDTIQGGSGAETVDASGAQSDFVQGLNSHLLFVGGSGGATILGGTGSDTYFGSAGRHVGSQLIEGGSAGNNFLFAGNGAATLVGGGDQDQLYAYGSNDQLLIAGSGNETLSAALSTGNDTLQAGSGHDLLIGGAGADTFIGGSGQSTVTAGFGSQTFDFINHAAGGTELVQGIFDPTSIQIHLTGYGDGAIHQALAGQTVTNGSVTIGLTDGTKITFQDVTSLSRSNFV